MKISKIWHEENFCQTSKVSRKFLLDKTWHINRHKCARRNENITKLDIRLLAHLHGVKPWGEEAKDDRESSQVRNEAQTRGLWFVVAYSIFGKEHPRRMKREKKWCRVVLNIKSTGNTTCIWQVRDPVIPAYSQQGIWERPKLRVESTLGLPWQRSDF